MPQDSIEEIVVQHGTAIDSIKFQTKCSKGFHGHASSSYLTAIGVFAKPKSPAPRPTSTQEAKIKN
ncbi:hypothetical protein M8C21_004795, partial [Ambrosia artemisiifolia]